MVPDVSLQHLCMGFPLCFGDLVEDRLVAGHEAGAGGPERAVRGDVDVLGTADFEEFGAVMLLVQLHTGNHLGLASLRWVVRVELWFVSSCLTLRLIGTLSLPQSG